MGATKIQWTNAVWNPVTGCSRVSEGCRHCYAERLAATRLAHLPAYAGLAELTPGGPRWTGEVRFNAERLAMPLRWRRPRMVFVNSQSDLFHEGLSDEQIAVIFAVMACCPRHTFQILTKRPERMRAFAGGAGDGLVRYAVRSNRLRGTLPGDPDEDIAWPLPGVWLGTSVEDQAAADARIPHLLATPAAVRFVSAEPLLGYVHIQRYLLDGAHKWSPKLHWVITGGESGPGARPANPDWFRSLRNQCSECGTAYFHKQNGEYVWQNDAAGGHSIRVGKHAAGRLLDGREHSAFPVPAFPAVPS